MFSGTVPDVGAGADYGYLLDDGEQLLPDPVSRWQPSGVHGPSRVVDPRMFRWSDRGWTGVAMADLVIYELHVGTFTPEGTFAAAIPYLRGLRGDLGVTAIEIMPVAQFPGTRNWGYDGVALYAVQNSYGGPHELAQLVDAAHAEGIAVILDVVYNHVGPEGNYLPLYGPYFTEKYKTPWGPALNYDDAHSDEVRRYMIENALYWVTEYHVDGLRLDAVHGIYDFSSKHLLQEIVERVHAQGERLGRRALVIGESDLNDPKLIRSVEKHGYGLDGQWSDDFHHAVHAALTGETVGYYADFGDVGAIAASLREPFVYDGRYSPHRKRRHGGSSVGIPREKFVVAIQNHDQIGNRASGDRLSTVLSPEKQRLAAALLLLSPYVPLLFMGQEYGETNPFRYFVSHGDPELVEAVRTGRRKEFQSFGWGDEVPDPEADETFRSCILNRDRAAGPEHAEHAGLFGLYRELIALRAELPQLRPDASSVKVDLVDGCITLLRTPRDRSSSPLLAVFNCSAAPHDVAFPGDASQWTSLFSSAGAWEAGRGKREAWSSTPPSGVATQPAVSVAPWSASLYRANDA